MDQLLGHVGKKAISTVNHILDLSALTYRLFCLMFQRTTEGRLLIRRAVLEQVYFTAVQALPTVILFALITGSMLIFQFAKMTGQYDLGKTAVLILVREIGPIMTAILVILRSATAVTIEISYMNVLHEIEAIEMTGIDPFRILGLPRLIGITSAILFLFIVFDIAAILGGYAMVWIVTDIPIGNFLWQIAKAISVSDIAVGIVKALLFGITITVTSLYHGFEAIKQMPTVPIKTSRAAVECYFFCLLFNVWTSLLFYL